MKKIIFLCMFLISYASTQAQPLEELISTAATNNLALKVLENNYFAALEKAPQVNQRPDPEIGLGLFPLPVETRLGGQALRLSAMQMLPWFGTLDGKEEVALAKAQVLYERIGANALSLHYQIKQAYFRLYEITQSQTIIQQNLGVLEALERLALAKVESGTTIAADVLRAQLKIEELKQELAILATKVIAPTTTINQILNRPLAQPIIISDSLVFADLYYDRTALIENIATQHPMLRSFDLQQEASRKAIDLNKLANKPTFGIGADYIMVNKRDDAMLVRNGRDIVQIKAVLKIPLYKDSYEAKEREENFNITALEYKKADVLSRFKATIETAYAAYEVARLQVNLYDKQIALTQATIRILETDYSANGNGFDELLQLQKELIDYDLKILRAIVQSHLAKSTIEQYYILK